MPAEYSWRSYLLGIFVLFQAIYLPFSNLIQLIPREMPEQKIELDISAQKEGAFTTNRPIQEAFNNVGSAIDRYGEVSGQTQFWKLFAPEFTTQSVFTLIDFTCADGRIVTIGPEYLPKDKNNYFRWPGSLSRLSTYEILLAVVYSNYSERSLQERSEDWRTAVLARVRQQQGSMLAYLRFNLKRFRELRPDCAAPREVMLKILVIPSLPPGHSERAPAFIVPLARWFPDRKAEPSLLPIEAYDPVAKTFVQLPEKEPGQ